MEVSEEELWADAQEMCYHLRVLTRRYEALARDHEALPGRVAAQVTAYVRHLAADPPDVELDRWTLEWVAARLGDTPLEVLVQDTTPPACP